MPRAEPETPRRETPYERVPNHAAGNCAAGNFHRRRSRARAAAAPGDRRRQAPATIAGAAGPSMASVPVSAVSSLSVASSMMMNLSSVCDVRSRTIAWPEHEQAILERQRFEFGEDVALRVEQQADGALAGREVAHVAGDHGIQVTDAIRSAEREYGAKIRVDQRGALSREALFALQDRRSAPAAARRKMRVRRRRGLRARCRVPRGLEIRPSR